MKRLILSCIAGVIVVTGIVVCCLRWNAWFGNPPESAYKVPSVPNNIVLTYGTDAAHDRTLSWRCDTALQASQLYLTCDNNPTDTLCLTAEGEVVASRAGKAAFYQKSLTALPSGIYHYSCQTGREQSAWYDFCIADTVGREFVVFGDVQDTDSASLPMYNIAFRYHPDYAAFVGDVIERPTDAYWQVFFNAMQGRQTSTPIVAATGNHEYLKGVMKRVDSRWTHVFGNPQNGPARFRGKTYYIDFPDYRLVVIDTDDLQLLSDYVIARRWLSEILVETACTPSLQNNVGDGLVPSRKNRWNIVIMHHPIFTAARKHRDYPLIRLFLQEPLQQADILFCGHDHNYMRRSISTTDSPWPVQLLTVSSKKFYAPKDSVLADCHLAYTRVYQHIRIANDTLLVRTLSADTDQLLDSLVLVRP